MKSEITLPNNKVKAEGKIIIEYTNGETGEVENRYESENHAFPGGFLRANNHWLSYNNNADSPFCIFLSDKGDGINYDIPLIPGNIIGYGYPGSNTSSTKQGSENINSRSLGVYSDGKWHYKRQWSWLPNQITSEIKSFGIGPYYAGPESNGEDSRRNMLPKQIPFNLKGDISVYSKFCMYDNKKAYSFSLPSYIYKDGIFITVYIYNLENDYNQSYTTVNLKDLLSIPEDMATKNEYYTTYNFAYFIDVDTNDIIIMFLYKTINNTPSVQIIRLDENCSQVKNIKTYPCGNYDYSSNIYPFSGYIGTAPLGYYKDNKFYLIYSNSNSYDPVLATINPSEWNEESDFMEAFSFKPVPIGNDGYKFYPAPNALVYKNGFPIFLTEMGVIVNNDGSIRTSSRYLATVINPEDNSPYATKYICTRKSGSQFFGKPFIENINNNNALIQLISYYDSSNPSYGSNLDGINTYYRNLSDYTLYVLPDNAPKREEGQGVTITYEIAWGYEEDN